MRRDFLVCIVKPCEANCKFFGRRRNAAGLLGLRSYQKISTAMLMIAHAVPADYTDKYLRIGKDTTLKSVRIFAKVIIGLFDKEYP